MLQTFFCTDAHTGQPVGFSLAASGKTCSQASLGLLGLMEGAGITKGLVLADKEHFTRRLAEYFADHPGLDMLIPAPHISSVTRRFDTLEYHRLWAGYAIAEATFRFKGFPTTYRLLVQRQGERPEDYRYKGFLTTSARPARDLLTHIYDKRWSIEEFFNFEGDMGWNRAVTFNLNIRYGKGSLALLAQAATHQLKSKLPRPYRDWSASTLAEKVQTNMEGDISIKEDTIVVTYYRDHEPLGLRDHYTNISGQLESKNISPKIPWLFDFKLQFRFK